MGDPKCTLILFGGAKDGAEIDWGYGAPPPSYNAVRPTIEILLRVDVEEDIQPTLEPQYETDTYTLMRVVELSNGDIKAYYKLHGLQIGPA